ncbi:MAG: Arc family DNA-binding protein [Mesorhizobium sp.]|nr:MAG: Arc family DNA-binding protein [Mesorhizobium sp.]TJW59039.1 MAG: Arc family DNA-binding protein [Mesorhizobium sp.]
MMVHVNSGEIVIFGDLKTSRVMQFRHKHSSAITARMAKNDPTFLTRLPPDLLKQIKISAAENGRSMNAEIVARLRRSYSDDDEDRQRTVRLLSEAIAIMDQGSR